MINYTVYKVILIAFFFITSIVNAQIGINTASPHPSSILDINSNELGILIPRLNTVARDTLSDPANGLIFYNTDSDEIQINTNTATAPVWEALASIPPSTSASNQSVKFSNTDITTNLNNNTAFNLPIFGIEEWNDNTVLYDSNNPGEIVIDESGRYEINVNVSLLSATNNARQSPEIRILVNGIATGSYGSTGYMRRTGGHNESSLHLREVVEVPAGSTLSIRVQRTGSGGTATMRDVGSSTIYINKIL